MGVDGAEVARDIAGRGERAEDVGQLCRVERALRLLAGNSVVELVLEGGMVRGGVPHGLGRDWAMELDIGVPLDACRTVERIGCARAVAGEAVKREGLRREFSGVILDRLAQCIGRFSGAEFARGGAEEQGYGSLFARFEGLFRRARNDPAIYDGPDGGIAPDGL
jgi:hypothetical protein